MRSLFVLIFSFLLVLNMKAQETQLIDRELFFGNPEISSGKLSPDGQWISFLKEYDGIMNIWVKKFDEPFEKARPLTDSPRPLYGYFWTYDGKYILYAKDKDGDENINIYSVDPLAPESKVPESRNLTPMEEVTARIYSVSQNDPDLLMIGLNDRDKAWHDLYSLKISTGELTKLHENKDRITGYNFDWDDQLRILYRTDEDGNTVMLRKDTNDKLTPIYKTNVSEQAYIYRWNEDNSKLYLVSNKGDINFSTLFLMDPVSKEITKIESDPENKVDFGGLRIDQNTRKIISTSYTDDKTRYYWKDKRWEENYKYLKKKFPGREVNFQSSTQDYKKFLVSVWGDKYASEAYFFDTSNKKLIHQYTPRTALKEVEKHLSPMKPVSYTSSDGLEITGYLTIPQGKKPENLPLVVLVHGGPKGPRDYWGYNSEVQFLANRGYAVLQPNFRASGGYGKDFLNAGDLQWGKLMQDDITWGVKYLINEGIADKDKIAIMGGSYGGYATLAGLAFTPDIYACGVDIVGPSNIFTLMESIPAYWEAARAFLYSMVGDPETEEGKKLIREASPLFHVDNIDKPLLIIQGANDPRVKKAESDQIVIALRDKGKQVDYLLADDEGHGFYKPVNRMAMYAETEKFLAGILGGRYQEDMPEDVAKRLKELKVDISKVTYEPAKAVSSATEFPEISNSFSEQKISYDILIEAQGQQIPMTMERTISQKGNNWLVTDHSKGAMGEAKDEIEYTPDFKPVERNVDQMGQKINMEYHPDKMKVSMMGREMEVAFEKVYVSDGPALDMLIGGLPLQNDFELVFDMPDLASMKAKQVKLKVLGKESIGNGNCWKVEIKATENENDVINLWINTVTRSADKVVQMIPAMGNAKMTMTKKM